MQMLRILPHGSIPSPKLPLLLQFKRNGRKQSRATSAKKSNDSEDYQTKESSVSPLRISRALVTKSAIVLFGLGFLDAGYSGDWSRIGVISKETEDALKLAAYLIVPSCFLLALFISDEEKAL